MGKYFHFLAIALLSTLTGCATTQSSITPSEANKKIAEINARGTGVELNPRHGEVIWGQLKVGMSINEVLQAVPNSYFDDQWTDLGAVAAMGEAGVFAKGKVMVTGEIPGPFGGPSTFYGLFDSGGRLDGVAISTLKKGLPASVSSLYGTLGFNLAEFKEAARLLIKDAPQALGKRVGAPRIGKEQMDSMGSVGVITSAGPNRAVGVGIPLSSISPSTISQKFERDGFKSTFAIRTMYLGLYGVYSAPLVIIAIQAKDRNSNDVPDVE